jgi:hypothetical protein
VKRPLLLATLLCLMPAGAAAKILIDPPPALPQDLTAADLKVLTVERASLLQQFSATKQAIDLQAEDCGSIEKDSPKVSRCLTKGTAVKAAVRDYRAALAQFERHIANGQHAHTCLQVAQLQNRFDSLTRQIALDLQVVQNFGFARTVADIEYWGRLPARQVEDAKKAFTRLLFDATLGLVSDTVGAVGSLTPMEADALNRLADAQGASPMGIVAGANDVHRALEFLDKTKGAYEAADTVRKGQMLDAAVKLGGLASKNPSFGLLLTADEWAGYQVYQSATAVKTVEQLTKVNEGDLILLKSRSEMLKDEVNQMTRVKTQLAAASSSCDSTSLVRRPE